MDDIIFPDKYTYKDWVKDNYKKLTNTFISKNFDIDANRRTLKAELQFSELVLLPKNVVPDQAGKYSPEELSTYLTQYVNNSTSREVLEKDVARLNITNVKIKILEEYPLFIDRDFLLYHRNYFFEYGLKEIKKLTGKALEERTYLRIRATRAYKAIPFCVPERDAIVVTRILQSTNRRLKEHREEIRKKEREHDKRRKELKLLEELKAKYEQ